MNAYFFEDDPGEDWREDAREEFEPHRNRESCCHDRMCGADDCTNCFPRPLIFENECDC